MNYWGLMKYRHRQWAALNPSERVMLLQAFLLLPVARTSRWAGFRRFNKIMRAIRFDSKRMKKDKAGNMQTARQAARMVSIAASHSPFRSFCLNRSLALWILLRLRGIDSELYLGVRGIKENFEAHAWVEIGGEVLNDTDDVRKRFAAFPLPITAPGACLHKKGPARV